MASFLFLSILIPSQVHTADCLRAVLVVTLPFHLLGFNDCPARCYVPQRRIYRTIGEALKNWWLVDIHQISRIYLRFRHAQCWHADYGIEGTPRKMQESMSIVGAQRWISL